jgi:hypothetical protein
MPTCNPVVLILQFVSPEKVVTEFDVDGVYQNVLAANC